MQKLNTAKTILVFVATTLPYLVLGNDSQDITNNREYRCRWYGGTSARLQCNCEIGAEMTIRRNSIPRYETTEIEINNCKSVHFDSNAIYDMMSLRSIYLKQIRSLSFGSESLTWYGYKNRGADAEERFDMSVPSLKVTVADSNVTLISNHAFSGRISEVTFDGVTIDRISPLAFANLLQTETVAIRNSVVRNFEVQAFKKFGTENLELNGLTVEIIPSRAFSSITVYENFTVDSCLFDTVRPGGFSIDNPKIIQVTNTNISQLDGEAFKITSRGTVIFRNNIFGVVNDRAFDGISLRREAASDVAFIFDSNTFSSISRYSLSISDFSVKYRNIFINEPCDCASLDRKIKESEYYGDIMCLHEDEYVTVKDYKSNMCSVITNYYITIIIICIVTTLLVAVASGLALYYKFVYRTKKYGSKNSCQNGNLSLIVPDGRTYRETELHVIVERTDLLTTDL